MAIRMTAARQGKRVEGWSKKERTQGHGDSMVVAGAGVTGN